MFASICTTDSDEELFTVGTSKSRYLTGSVVSSLYHLRDPVDNIYSAFFVFPGAFAASLRTWPAF